MTIKYEMTQGVLFKKIVEETRKAKIIGYNWEQYANGRTIEELVQENLAEFYVEVIKHTSLDHMFRN